MGHVWIDFCILKINICLIFIVQTMQSFYILKGIFSILFTFEPFGDFLITKDTN